MTDIREAREVIAASLNDGYKRTFHERADLIIAALSEAGITLCRWHDNAGYRPVSED